MADFEGHDNRMSVPQFGAWVGKTNGQTNYSMVFSQARANRKKHKGELIHPHSLGNEKELLKQLQHNQDITHAGKHENRMFVPEFGAGDGKTKDQTNYPVLLSQAYANRENLKSELVVPCSLGNEKELLEQQRHADDPADAGMHENWMSVPQFGGWDGKSKNQTNYSVVFSQARANRKNHKSELVAPRSLGNKRELLERQQNNDHGAGVDMHDNKMSIPQFGAWDRTTKDQTNYPSLLSQACANKKNDKSELVTPHSLGNEREHLEQQLHTDDIADIGMYDNEMSGAWDGKIKDQSNYPILLSQAHANRKNHNSELVVPCSIGNERELLEQQQHNDGGADAGMHNLMSLPQFGAWDGKSKDQTNYSVVFSQARANRKKHMNKLMAPHSLGSERELLEQQQHFHDSYPVAHAGMRSHEEKKKKMRRKHPSCFSCFSFKL